jgi:hypothetical protein
LMKLGRKGPISAFLRQHPRLNIGGEVWQHSRGSGREVRPYCYNFVPLEPRSSLNPCGIFTEALSLGDSSSEGATAALAATVAHLALEQAALDKRCSTSGGLFVSPCIHCVDSFMRLHRMLMN